jgi:hypothetical protein
MSVYEDSNIIINPNPNDIQSFSTLYLVTLKDQTKTISIGINKSIEEYTYSGVGPFKIMAIESTKLFISIFGVTKYVFNCTINNLNINNLSSIVDITNNGIQFLRSKPLSIQYSTGNFNQNYKIDNNKYYKMSNK